MNKTYKLMIDTIMDIAKHPDFNELAINCLTEREFILLGVLSSLLNNHSEYDMPSIFQVLSEKYSVSYGRLYTILEHIIIKATLYLTGADVSNLFNNEVSDKVSIEIRNVFSDFRSSQVYEDVIYKLSEEDREMTFCVLFNEIAPENSVMYTSFFYDYSPVDMAKQLIILGKRIGNIFNNM